MKKSFFSLFTCIILAISSQAQLPAYVPTNSLAAWYSLDGNANDASGNGNNAANIGVTFIADRNGNVNAAGSFNGSTSVLTVNVPSFTFSETGAFTYTVWMNKGTQSTAGVVMMSGTNTAGNFISNIQGQTNVQFGTNKQQFAWVWAQCPHTLNQWDHYAAVYDNGAMILYKNGVSSGSALYSNWGAASVNLPFYIGRGLPGGGNNYNGALDEIGVWTRALSATEISNIYNSIPAATTDLEKVKIHLFPNPAQQQITLKMMDSFSGLDYIIYDQAGKEVSSGLIKNEKTSVDVHQLPPGNYLIKLGSSAPIPFNIVK